MRASDSQVSPGGGVGADIAMMAALATAMLMAVVLAAMLWTQARINEAELEVVSAVRRTRAEIFAATILQREAEILFAEHQSGQPLARQRLAAVSAEADQHMETARRLMRGDPEFGVTLDQFEAAIDRRFAEIESDLQNADASNRAAADDVLAIERELQAQVSRTIDASRARERDTDGRIALIAGLLLLLTIGTASTGFVALRRARMQWRIADEAAEEARERARASDTAKSRFLAVASHDMRQPLHALTLYLSALERRVEGGEAREIISKMDRAVQSMSGMFAALVDLARMQAGVIAPDWREAPVAELISRAAARHSGVHLIEPLPQVAIRTDPSLFDQVLSNLMANAVGHGGGVARVSARCSGQEIEITISDDGPGIPVEEQERIFDEFERLDKHSSGLGLGLTIVRHLTRLLGLALELQSTPGSGATFTLRSPLASGATDPEGAALDQATARGAKVFVLDDDALVRGAMEAWLSDLGGDVATFADEASFVAALHADAHPRLVIMDLRIEGEIKGLRIANETISKLDPPPRVIIVTGDTEAGTLADLQRSGHAILIKPVSPEALKQAALRELAS